MASVSLGDVQLTSQLVAFFLELFQLSKQLFIVLVSRTRFEQLSQLVVLRSQLQHDLLAAQLSQSRLLAAPYL